MGATHHGCRVPSSCRSSNIGANSLPDHRPVLINAPMGPAASPAGHPHHRNPVDGHPPCSPGTVTCRILGPRDEDGNLEPSAELTTPFVEAHESPRGRRPGRPATPNSDKGPIFSVHPMRSSHSPGVPEVYGAATR